MGCCVHIEENIFTLMILANGCNITKSETFKRGSEFFPYPLNIIINNYPNTLSNVSLAITNVLNKHGYSSHKKAEIK